MEKEKQLKSNSIKNPGQKLIINQSLVRLYILSLIVAFFNTLFFSYKTIAFAFVVVECGILVCDLISRDTIDYLGHYILFCGLSLEFDALAGATIYSFKEIRVGGINIGVLSLIPVFLLSLFQSNKPRSIKNSFSYLSAFSFHYLIIVIISLLVGLLLYAANDNGIQRLGFNIIIEELYQRGFQPLMMMGTVVLSLQKDKNCLNRLSGYLEATLIGVVFSMLISLASGVFGFYGGVNTLLTSVNIRWIPLLLLFPLYKQYKNRVDLFVFGIIGMILSLLYNATGKMIIAYFLIPVICVLYHIVHHENKKIFLWLAIIPVLFLLSFPAISYLSDFSKLFNSKMNQVRSLLSFLGSTTKMNNMLTSPRTRVYEIWVTLQEYYSKPHLFLLGKGLGGTILASKIPYDNSAFSELEMRTGLVYNLHESFAKLLLSNGLYGILFYGATLLQGLRKFSKSPWMLIGVYWFSMSFGYSITMTAFGLSALLYGIYECDKYGFEEG